MDIESRVTRKSIWKGKWMKVEKKDDDNEIIHVKTFVVCTKNNKRQ